MKVRKLIAAMLVAFLVLAGGACGAPSTVPTPTSTPTPTPTPTPLPERYSVSGTLTDDAGVALMGALVEIGFATTPGGRPFVNTTTDNAGRFALEFAPSGPLGNVPTPSAGQIIAFARDHDHTLQFLPWGSTPLVKDLVVRLARSITAGESTTVSVDALSSICSDLEDWFIPTRQCAQIHVVAPANGSLVIDAVPVQDPSAVPIVFSATSGFYRRQVLGTGTVTLLEVQAGRSYHIFVGAPVGVAAQQYTVRTSIQPSPSAY